MTLLMNCKETWIVHWGGHVATRDCEFFVFFIFSCFALRKVSLISAFVIALGVVFC